MRHLLSLAVVTLTAGVATSLSQPTPAQPASPFPEEVMASAVQQMSDSLAAYITGASCSEVASMVKMIPTDGSSPPPDPNSIIGSVILTVKNSPNLQSTIATRVGPPLINKMLECNMVPVELLMRAAMTRNPK